ncbi:MAG: alkaline phosphatase family protein [Actinomycetota bacterium]|nr:alkaline phosphatase family protein [Actinomycetota bacterium]
MANAPSYDGSGLVNLIAEVEGRMTGSSPSPGLSPRLADAVPGARTYVLVLFDGLGTAQLAHRGAGTFRSAHQGTLEAPFPTTTSVSLATIATGLPPSLHGQVAHLNWMPDLGLVVNSLKWLRVTGEPVQYDYPSFLPNPNLWERLRASGVEPITVQPGDFSGSPLTRVLYRGARFEGAWDERDIVDATVQLAGEPNRFIFTYVPHVDFAGHVHGLNSEEFAEAISTATTIWEGIAAALPPDVALLGTADHGLLEFTDEQKVLIREPRFDPLRFAGDTRGVQLWGDRDLMADLAESVGGDLTAALPLLGPTPTDQAAARVGDRVLLAPDDRVFIPKGFDKRLRCYHGGLSRDEVEIPLLVG